MPPEQRCKIRFPRFAGGGVCDRLLPRDMCDTCKAYEGHKDEWHAIFSEFRDAPRVAVEGDI